MPIDYKAITYETPEKELPNYWSADLEVIQTAERLIEDNHPHLGIATIAFIFRKKAGKSQGKTVLGKAAHRPEKERLLADMGGTSCHFVITLPWDVWKILEPKQQTALVDHELCHCIYEGDTKGNVVPKIKAHDVEEFREIINRHGFWNQDLQLTAVTFAGQEKQLSLFSAGAANPSSEDETTVTVRNTQTGKSVTMTGKEFEGLPEKIRRLPRRPTAEGKEAAH